MSKNEYVSLKLFGRESNRDDYKEMTTLPKDQLEFLQSGLKVDAMDSFMYGCTNLIKLPRLDNIDTYEVRDMGHMFVGCDSLKSLDLSNFDTSNVKNMSYMFFSCGSLPFIDLSSFNTSDVTHMTSMFEGCKDAQFIDVSSFRTLNVLAMQRMFRFCTSLKYLDLSKFDTSRVNNMNEMFYGCTSLKYLDISNFSTANIRTMKNMFYRTSNLKYLIINNPRLDFIPIYDQNIGLPEDCKILVPSESISTYQNTIGWDEYKNQFEAIEDYDIIKQGDGTMEIENKKYTNKYRIAPKSDNWRNNYICYSDDSDEVYEVKIEQSVKHLFYIKAKSYQDAMAKIYDHEYLIGYVQETEKSSKNDARIKKLGKFNKIDINDNSYAMMFDDKVIVKDGKNIKVFKLKTEGEV